MTGLNKFLNSNMEDLFHRHACVLCRINGKLLAIDFLKTKIFFSILGFFPKVRMACKINKKIRLCFHKSLP